MIGTSDRAWYRWGGGGAGGGGGDQPEFFSEIAVDQQTRTRDRI